MVKFIAPLCLLLLCSVCSYGQKAFGSGLIGMGKEDAVTAIKFMPAIEFIETIKQEGRENQVLKYAVKNVSPQGYMYVAISNLTHKCVSVAFMIPDSYLLSAVKYFNRDYAKETVNTWSDPFCLYKLSSDGESGYFIIDVTQRIL